MKFVVFLIIFIYHNILKSEQTNLDREIDSLKHIVLTENDKSSREYHSTIIELFRKYRFNEMDSATYYLNYGIDISSKLKLDLITRDYYNIKGLYFFDRGDLSKALENFYKCLEYSIKTNEVGAIGFSYADIGYVFYVQGLWDLALRHYLDGIDHLSRTDSISTISMGLLYQNTGLSYGQLNMIDSAEKYLNLALEFYKNIDHLEKINHTYMYLGHLNRRNKLDYEQALEYYYKSLNYFEQDKGFLEGYTYSLYHIGEVYALMGDNRKAIEYFEKCLEDMKRIGWKKKMFDVNIKLSEIYIDLNDYKKVDSIFKFNSQIIEEFEAKDLYLDDYLLRYKLAKKKNQIDSALYFYELYNKLSNEFLQSTVTGQVATVLKDMQILKNTKEKQIIMEKNVQRIYLLLFIIILTVFLIALFYSRLRLQKKNMIIFSEKNEALEKANQLLDEANNTKDKFFSIIAHDLKNPIGAIKSTSELLHNEFEHFDTSDIKESIEDIYKSSTSVQNLLDSLLTWSRSQRGMIEFNPEGFNLNLLVNNIYQLFDKSVEDKKIRLTKNIEEDFLVFADSNMLNTIIRNLVSNSIKFTPQNGEINISVYKENNKTILTISDTGIGISKENQEKLFNFGTNYSTLGTNNEKGTGLGLILVFEFIQKHNGDIKIDSEIGKGTKFIITIPDA